MSELSKTYDFKALEPYWYAQWLSKDAFKPVVGAKETYTIVIPPPNVTGVLTLGHVLNNTIQDILIRRARLEGKAALWIPGTDHAGLATQVKVEQWLRKEKIDKRTLSREQFLGKINEWCTTHGGIILNQLQRLGASCDWTRKAYTMDDDYYRAVITAFVELYHQGLIYRGYRMVNWCPKSLTGLSDEEVVMKEEEGIMAHMRYEVVEHPGEYLEIETTRPETLMGDTAVAVHPQHPKYSKYIGLHVWRPFPRAQIPVIGDEAALLDFGTGALKVTPAHDPVDFEIGKRHNLAVINVFNPNATLNENAGADYVGLTREAARAKAIEQLKAQGNLIKIKPYVHSVGYSERENVAIEPRLSEQWWLKYPCVEEAKEVVASGKIKFYPERWSKVYNNWMGNIRDWCISRQVIWGQRIPVWYRKGADRNLPANQHCSIDGPADKENWEQETDVLDTWASSWLWPLATLGWPNKDAMAQRGLAQFYPTTTLVTGPDIIFFWVARMVMAGLRFGEGQVPFKNVYFTGIVRDAQGRKMSKSLGNSPDPLDLFAKYGADGVRFAMMQMAPTGQDIMFSEDRVEQGRNFCTKLWNASRFRQMQGERTGYVSQEQLLAELNPSQMDAYDHWILNRLVETTALVEQSFASFDFAAMSQGLYAFFWGDFCDWYVEATKARLRDEAQKTHILAVQDLVLRQTLMLLQPFVPHITEELWQRMGFAQEGVLLQANRVLSAEQLGAQLSAKGLNAQQATFIAQLSELVAAGRELKADNGLASRRDVAFTLKTTQATILTAQKEVLERFLGAKSLTFSTTDGSGPARVTPIGTLYLDLAAAVTAEDKVKMAKQLTELEAVIASAQSKLDNPAFSGKAPANVIAGVRQTMEQNMAKAEELRRLLQPAGV